MAEFKLGRIRFIWKDIWIPLTQYFKDDVIRNGGKTYICVEGHISSALFSSDEMSKWNKIADGQEWRGEWQSATLYNKNDIVMYGGYIYIANTSHVSATNVSPTFLGLEEDQGKWDKFAEGFGYKESWESNFKYKINDIVKYGGGTWICVTPHISQLSFEDDESKWMQFADGIQYRNEWSSSSKYQVGDFVTYGGFSYISSTNNINLIPTENSDDWELFTSGFEFVGEWTNDSSNQQFKVGQVVTLNGFTYLCIQDHDTEQRPPDTVYWKKLNSGFFWKDAWADDEFYNQGDVVRINNFSYVCVLEHLSDEIGNKAPLNTQNRPDQDISGVYWNLISGGAENNVLTTQGDLIYYSGAGPARLPIGQPGQVLTVNETGEFPEWKFFGQTTHVYYVESSNGEDFPAPIFGTTADKPWKTVKYAAEQIDYGPIRPNARFFLERNRSFVQAEVVEWVDYQIANNIAPFDTAFLYDKEKCRRDVGLIIDAVVYDLTHGGNESAIAAAKSYFLPGETYITGPSLQTAAALDYAEIIIAKIIQNFDPDDSYQTINSVADPITQVKNSNIAVEPNTQSLISSLLSIITDAIVEGNVDSLPVTRRPNNSIFVKTGLFTEVLPIIVPHETAVIGDELRSTKIVAAGSLIDSADTPYTIDALGRLRDIIKNIVSNPVLVVKTTGNALNPVTSRPKGSGAVGDVAEDLVQQIVDYIEWGINGASGTSTQPLTTGTNIPNATTDYTYGVESLEANRDFIKAEIEAYIADQYPGYSYNVDLCLRDIDRYIDAIKYDLIFTGNYKSLLAARYYVNAVNGSQLEDMFYLRNGTGLRNFSVNGLNGTLAGPNQYGTFRPTAGAYASLDPGWGPDDTRAWILKRSPYVQNVSTFGTGCVGLKVDGALHNGGNDSIVANDFTQLISDGIGAWVTNLGRSELVSVFSYYAHIGYLAENGGKIRATNGNNSYGEYGSVSEGVDASETPITAQVDNRARQASIRRTITNGNNILVFEYDNAGQNYTPSETNFIISGEGFGAVVDEVQTTNGGIFQIRMLDFGDDSSGQFGGEGFKTATNVAQSGNATSITIANTDTVTNSGAYAGMAIYIVAGAGAGQYGYIQSYNAGTKVAQIYKTSDDTPGWDHVVPGTSIVTVLDGTTQYVIEPRIIIDDPTSGTTAQARPVVEDGKIIEVLIWNPGSGYDTPAPGVTFVDPSAIYMPPYEVRIADGVLAQPTWTNRGTAFVTAGARIEGDGFADNFQAGTFVTVKNLQSNPQLGSNIVFDSITGKAFKLVFVRGLLGPDEGPFSAELQISPALELSEALDHETEIELRIRYSQVRLTGHDFLDIGTGNFESTNYPGIPLQDSNPENETVELGGGRVFYTSTDQDGNFRVGDLFSVEQSTGIATLDADAFNITGLQELTLGELGLGSSGAVITEFSTDGTFSADSDNIVPTQRAIKTFITSQIGGGSATLNVNNITAGQVQISGQQITTTTGVQINVFRKLNLLDGVDGVPLALNYFLK
jgi:hypothetical protein